MTDTEIIIEVAKLDGWTIADAPPNNHGWKFGLVDADGRNQHNSDRPEEFEETLPRYLTSRDAIIPVIEKQHPGVLLAISKRIKDETHHSTPTLAGILAPPRRLCIALLKETGKWRDQ